MKVIVKQANRYSEATARKYIETKVPIKCVTSFIETQYEYVNNKATNNVRGFKLWFAQEGLNPFTVKFEKKPELPPFFSIIEFENLQGIEIKNNVYFKADGIKVIK